MVIQVTFCSPSRPYLFFSGERIVMRCGCKRIANRVDLQISCISRVRRFGVKVSTYDVRFFTTHFNIQQDWVVVYLLQSSILARVVEVIRSVFFQSFIGMHRFVHFNYFSFRCGKVVLGFWFFRFSNRKAIDFFSRIASVLQLWGVQEICEEQFSFQTGLFFFAERAGIATVRIVLSAQHVLNYVMLTNFR